MSKNKINLKTCDGICHECVKQYAKKHKLGPKDQFEIVCEGIPKKYIPDSVLASIPHDPELAIAMLDPVTWAAKFLDWHCLDPDGSIWKRKTLEGSLGEADPYDPVRAIEGKSPYHRPYQAAMVRCQAKRKVFVCGRQVGKCLPTGTQVLSAEGYKNIEDIQTGELVVCFDGYKTTQAPAFLSNNGVKPVYEIILSDGRKIEATGNHPFFCREKRGTVTSARQLQQEEFSHGHRKNIIFKDRWKPLEDLTLDDFVAVPRRVLLSEDSVQDPDKLRALAYMIAEGGITNENCRFSNANQNILNDFEEILNKKFNCTLKKTAEPDAVDYDIVGCIKYKNSFRSWLRDMKVWGKSSYEKCFPQWIYRLSKENIGQVLRTLYDCDGWFCINNSGGVEIGYCTCSKLLSDQILILLNKLGIYARREWKKSTCNGKIFHAWQITIHRKRDITNFYTFVGSNAKKESLEKVFLASNIKKSSFKTECYETEDLVFIKVKQIRYLGEKQTWDLTVPTYHNFIAENILVHNTISLCITILYHIFTRQNFSILILAPYQSQIDLIFTKVNNFISSSPTLQSSIKRNVKAPNYTIELHNKSIVHGFTAGTKSNNAAGSVRGQCLAEGTLVRLANGDSKTIEEIKLEDNLLSYDANWNSCNAKVTHIFSPEVKDVYEIVTQKGRRIEASLDHTFFTPSGECSLENLNCGDRIAIPKQVEAQPGTGLISDRMIKILAYLIGDGCISGKSIGFTNANPVILEEYKSFFSLDSIQVDLPKSKALQIRLNKQCKIEIKEAMREYGLLGKHSWDKFIPNIIKESPIDKQILFLSRLYATDGWATLVSKRQQYEIGYCTTSKILANDIIELLNNLGIVGTIQRRNKKFKQCKTHLQYIVKLRDHKNVKLFLEKITIFSKEPACEKIKYIVDHQVHKKNCCVEYSKQEIKNILESHNLSFEKIRYRYNKRICCSTVTEKTIQFLYEKTGIIDFLKILERDIVFDKIISITPLGQKKTYDIEVESTRKFIANNIVVHNSASMLILEEADYLAPSDMDSVAAVITNFPQATVIMSSTPTGRRERFYENAHNKTFKTFHFPSYVNPNWTSELDAFYKSSLTSIGYQHEVRGEFGSQEEGVYQLKFIEAAQDDYSYGQIKRYPDWIYSMGVDWNDIKIGTSIVITGWNPQDGMFRVVDKLCVSKEGWQQIYACQKVVDMNRMWKPRWIYIDLGFGHMQAEILRKYGLDSIVDPSKGPAHIDSKLARIVKPYDFGSSVEVRDPFTKQMVKRPAKPFLVENSMRRFETLSIRYPKEDEQMTRALLGYKIKRVSLGGVPVYEQADTEAGDHFLDAMNLALLAYTLEESEFGKPKYQTNIAYTQTSPMTPTKKESPVKEKESPTTGRSDIPQPSVRQSQMNATSWPGFWRDEPKPGSKQHPNRLFPSRGYYRPQRKNI